MAYEGCVEGSRVRIPLHSGHLLPGGEGPEVRVEITLDERAMCTQA